MEKKLRKLFDYQKFSKNKDLQLLIDDCESRYPEGVLVSDEALSFAVGGKNQTEEDKNKKDREELFK